MKKIRGGGNGATNNPPYRDDGSGAGGAVDCIMGLTSAAASGAEQHADCPVWTVSINER